MNEPYEDIAARLRVAIDAFGMKDAEFARGARITPNALSNYMSGRFRLGLTAALAIREAYGLSLDWLYCGGSVDKLPNNVRAALIDKPRDNHSR